MGSKLEANHEPESIRIRTSNMLPDCRKQSGINKITGQFPKPADHGRPGNIKTTQMGDPSSLTEWCEVIGFS